MGDLYNPKDPISKLQVNQELDIQHQEADKEDVPHTQLGYDRPSAAGAFLDGISSAIPYTLDYTYAAGSWDSLNRPEDQGDLIYPGELKKIGIDSVDPMTTWAADIELKRRNEALAANEQFGQHFSWNTPINAGAALFGQLVTYAFSPSSIALGFGFHSGIKGSIAAIRAAKKAGGLRAFEGAGMKAQAAKAAKTTPSPSPELEFGEKFLRNGMYPAVPSAFENATEALLVHGEHAKFGNKYDVVPELYASVFLPALIVGGANVIRNRFNKPRDLSETAQTQINQVTEEFKKKSAEAESVNETLGLDILDKAKQDETVKGIFDEAGVKIVTGDDLAAALQRQELDKVRGKTLTETELSSNRKVAKETQNLSALTVKNNIEEFSDSFIDSALNGLEKKIGDNFARGEFDEISEAFEGSIRSRTDQLKKSIDKRTEEILTIRDNYAIDVNKAKTLDELNALKIKRAKNFFNITGTQRAGYGDIVKQYKKEIRDIADKEKIEVKEVAGLRDEGEFNKSLNEIEKQSELQAEAVDLNKRHELSGKRLDFNYESKAQKVANLEKEVKKAGKKAKKAQKRELAKAKKELKEADKARKKEKKEFEAKADDINKKIKKGLKKQHDAVEEIKDTKKAKFTGYKVFALDDSQKDIYNRINKAIKEGDKKAELDARIDHHKLLPEVIIRKKEKLEREWPNSVRKKIEGELERAQKALTEGPKRIKQLQDQLKVDVPENKLDMQLARKITDPRAVVFEEAGAKLVAKIEELKTGVSKTEGLSGQIKEVKDDITNTESNIKRVKKWIETENKNKGKSKAEIETRKEILKATEKHERLRNLLIKNKNDKDVSDNFWDIVRAKDAALETKTAQTSFLKKSEELFKVSMDDLKKLLKRNQDDLVEYQKKLNQLKKLSEVEKLNPRQRVFLGNMRKLHKRFPDFIEKLEGLMAHSRILGYDLGKVDELYPYLSDARLLDDLLRNKRLTDDDLLNFDEEAFSRFADSNLKTHNQFVSNNRSLAIEPKAGADSKNVTTSDTNVNTFIGVQKQYKDVSSDYVKCLLGGEALPKIVPPPKITIKG